MTANRTYYAYIHCRPDGTPFYVGKGHGVRATTLGAKAGRSFHHANTVRKYGAENILVGKLDCSTEAIAFDLERGLIKCLRRMGVSICNKTDGGDGTSGYVPTVETRRKLSEAGMGRVVSAETRAKKSVSRKAQMAADPSIAENLSHKLKGRVFSAEHLERLRVAQQRSYAENPERAERIAAGNRGKTPSPESKAKRVEALKQFYASERGIALREAKRKPRGPMSAETKRKIAEKALARHLANPEILRAMSKKAHNAAP